MRKRFEAGWIGSMVAVLVLMCFFRGWVCGEGR
jgi:hypothetical protein